MKTVKDLMTRDVQTIVSTAAIAEAAKLMRDGDFGLLPVGTPERLEGTISDRDIVIRAIAEGKGADTPVAGVMSAGVSAVREDDMSAVAACEPRYRLADRKIESEPSHRELPIALIEYAVRAEKLYDRVLHLDQRMYLGGDEEQPVNPVQSQLDRLQAAFGG